MRCDARELGDGVVAVDRGGRGVCDEENVEEFMSSIMSSVRFGAKEKGAERMASRDWREMRLRARRRRLRSGTPSGDGPKVHDLRQRVCTARTWD